jgi:benzoate membrane transport protein
VLQPLAPVLDWRAIVSLGLPLFLVTLVAQNVPGFVVLRSSGYIPPTRAILFVSGIASLCLAPFGAHSVNLGAVTAAICTGDDAHPDPAQRYGVGIVYGSAYLLLAAFAAPLVGLFTAMPPHTVAAIAGVALIGPLISALGAMLEDREGREAAVLTFTATASGITMLGIGPAFWGLVVGFLALGVRRWFARAETKG